MPFVVFPLMASMVLFVQNVLLGFQSPEGLKLSASVIYLTQMLQAACNSCAHMTQGHVSRYLGEGSDHMIGSGVWQMIWFSLLSILVTFPLGLLGGHFYFAHLSMQKEAMSCYTFFLAINFLFPLGVTLANYYMGIKKTRFIVFTNIGFSLLQVALFYFLILPFGLWGWALSTLTAQMIEIAIGS